MLFQATAEACWQHKMALETGGMELNALCLMQCSYILFCKEGLFSNIFRD